MKKGLLILASIVAVVLLAIVLLRQREAPSDNSITAIEEATTLPITEPDSLAEDQSPVPKLTQELHSDPGLLPTPEKSRDEGNGVVAALQSLEESLIERKLHQAQIAAKYSSSGDGVLSEADFRRYAQERYVTRRDLNGDGKVDGFELRASAQRPNVNLQETSESVRAPKR